MLNELSLADSALSDGRRRARAHAKTSFVREYRLRVCLSVVVSLCYRPHLHSCGDGEILTVLYERSIGV